MSNAALESSDWGMDQRSQERWHLVGYLRVMDVADDKVLGHLVDVTTEGFMLISEQLIPEDQRFTLCINCPDEDGVDQRIEFAAISIWTRPDSTPYFYNSGFSLIDPPTQVTAAIEQLISALKRTQD